MRLNRLIGTVAVVLTVALSSGAANAAFTGYYSLGPGTHWVSDTPWNGSIDTTGIPDSVALVSPNDVNNYGNSASTTLMITPGSAGDNATLYVSFQWSYTTLDGSSTFDPFFFLLNGNPTQLTADGVVSPQSGSYSIQLHSGDTFGFEANSVDSWFGSATTTITDFTVAGENTPYVTSVPEPESFAMLLAGLGLLGFMARRRMQNETV